MDWIEELFGISPDGGSGAVEFMILAALGLTLAAVGIRLRRYFEERSAGKRDRKRR